MWAYAPPLRFFGPSCDHNFRNARNTSDPHYAEVVPSVSLRSCVGCYSIYLWIVSPSILVPCPTGVGNMFQVVDFLFHLAVNHEVVPEFDGVGVPWFCGKGRAVFHCGWVRNTYMEYLFRENLLDRNIVTLLPWQLNPQQMCFSYMCTLGESKSWRFAYLL